MFEFRSRLSEEFDGKDPTVNEGRAEGSEKWEGLVGMAGRAHSVRPESCDALSSPEPAARWCGGGEGWVGGVGSCW